MIPYIVYAAMITAVCFLFYRLLLHRETFFSLNRWFFLGCLICSFSIPLLHVPGGWSIRKYMASVSPFMKASYNPTGEVTADPTVVGPFMPEVGGASGGTGSGATKGVMTVRSASVATPKEERGTKGTPNAATEQLGTKGTLNVVTAHSVRSMPVAAAIGKTDEAAVSHPGPAPSFSWMMLLRWIYYAYLFGVLIFGMNLLVQLLVLLFQAYGKPMIRDGLFRIIETGGNRAPCSFGHYIFINPSLYDPETFNQILSHEKIHVRQRHSVDILMAEICIVIQWFNPFAWYYRKALEDNLEFLTDAAMIRNPAINPSTYQMSLLRVSAPHIPLSITSNYNQSLLKKRIVMMHVQKSSARTTWKYLFLLPLFTGLVCVFNDTIAGKSGSAPSLSLQTGTQVMPEQTVPVSPRTPLAQSLPPVAPLAQPGIGAQSQNLVQVDPMTNVSPTVNVSIGDDDAFTSGTWMATIKGDEVELMLKSENGHSSDNSTFKKSEFSALPTGHKADFTLSREAGTLTLNGVFDGDDGFGHFTFKENGEFRSFLEKQGVTGVNGREMFGVFITNVKKSYVEALAQNGYAHPTLRNLIAMSAMNIDIAYIQSCKQMGYPDLPVHDLIAMKSMNIDQAYIKDLKQGGFTDLAVHDLIAAKSMDIDAAYVQSWKQSGYQGLRMRDFISLKSMGVDGAYAQGWKQAGYGDLPAHDLISLKSMGVDEAYAQSWKQAGYNDLAVHDLISLKSMGVDEAYVQSWKQVGYNDLAVHDLVSLKSMGVDGAYVQSWKELGYGDLAPHDLVSMKSVGVDGAYIREMKEAGFDHLAVHELISLKSMGVTGAYVKEVQKLGDSEGKLEPHEVIEYKSMGIDGKFVHSFEQVGYSHLAPHELVELKALGITPEFIKGYYSIGFKDIPVHTLAELKSMGVTSDYVSAMKNKGFNSSDLQEYVKLKTFK